MPGPENLHSLFTPWQLGALRLPNRVIKAATFEGMCLGGLPESRLIEHHRQVAAGGVALTTVAYCAVQTDGRTFPDQMVMSEAIHGPLKKLTQAVHEQGGFASLQLSHCGFFTRNPEVKGRGPLAPSRLFNAYGLLAGMPFSRAMQHKDLAAVTTAFADAAHQSRECGFDAIELHLGHGYLLSQFLSPSSNRRKDEYGGSLENRMRLPLEVVRACRERLGPDFPILCKINLSDGFPGGQNVDDAITLAKELDLAGASALVTSGGFVSRTPFYLFRGERPLRQMIQAEESLVQRWAMRLFGPFIVRRYPFEENFFRNDALRVRREVNIPMVLLGGVHSAAAMSQAMGDGFDGIALGRPLIHDPAFVNRIRDGAVSKSACTHCNQCVAEMERNGVRCVLNG